MTDNTLKAQFNITLNIEICLVAHTGVTVKLANAELNYTCYLALIICLFTELRK